MDGQQNNQSGWNRNETPRTYGEDTKMYQNRQNASQQPNYGNVQDMSQQPNYGNGQNAYQQPNYGNGQNAYQQPNYGNGQNTYQQPNYGNGQNPYQQPNYGKWQGNPYPQEQHGPVSDVLCNILLLIFMAQIIINFVVFGATWNAMAGEGIDAYLDGSVSLGSPVQMLSMFSNLLFVAMLVLLILDIVKISNQKYKITGLVLFAIFLRPGYYVWRAHVLKRKMTFPIIYTIVYSGVTVAYFFYSFYKVFSLTFGIMQSLN